MYITTCGAVGAETLKKYDLRRQRRRHAKTKQTIDIPLDNDSLYAFSKDINIEWRHGIPQITPDKYKNEGRISIIAWGKIDMREN